jgi:hypothetical protein
LYETHPLYDVNENNKEKCNSNEGADLKTIGKQKMILIDEVVLCLDLKSTFVNR